MSPRGSSRKWGQRRDRACYCSPVLGHASLGCTRPDCISQTPLPFDVAPFIPGLMSYEQRYEHFRPRPFRTSSCANLAPFLHLPWPGEDSGVLDVGGVADGRRLCLWMPVWSQLPIGLYCEQEINFYCIQSMRFRCLSVQQLVSP